MFTHRDVAAAIRRRGGDYLLFVKDNQPELKAQMQAVLHGDAAFSPLPTQAEGNSGTNGPNQRQGAWRRERRRLISTTCLFELERVRECAGKTEVEVAYGIASLTWDQAHAKDLLAYARGHWGIENHLHSVRGETLGEDRCRVRKGVGPQVLAAIRNVAVFPLDQVEAVSKAAARRRFAAHPAEALPLPTT